MAAHVVGPAGEVVGIDPSPAAVEAARRIDVTSIVEWRNWEGRGFPSTTRPSTWWRASTRCTASTTPMAVLAEMRRVLAPGGRLGIMTWGPIEENPAFAAELDAIVKSGLDQSGVVEVLLDAFAFHRIEDLRALVHGAGFTDVSCRTVRMLAALPRRGPVGPGLPVAPAAVRRPGATAANRPASSSWPGPPSCCDPSSTTGVLRVQASSRLVVARAPVA